MAAFAHLAALLQAAADIRAYALTDLLRASMVVAGVLNRLSSRATIAPLEASVPLAQPVAEISAATKAPNAVLAAAASHRKRMIAATDIGAMLVPSAGELRRISALYDRVNSSV